MLIFLFLILIPFGVPDISPSKKGCATFYLSIGAVSKNITINWYLNCTNDTRPDKLVFFKYKQPLKVVKLKKAKKEGVLDTGYSWNFEKFPGGWLPSNSYVFEKSPICYPYTLKSYKTGQEQDSECLKVDPIWMSKFKAPNKYRIGDMFIPGTHRSTDLHGHQNYNIWGQLVFGMRYFDIVVNSKDLRKNIDPFMVNAGLYKELRSVQRFMELTKKEFVILDFRGFTNFQGESDHEWLIRAINSYLGRWLLTRQLKTKNSKGPLIEILWETDMRVIINYRDPKIVEKNIFLWNEIFVNDGKQETPNGLKKFIFEAVKVPYEEKMSSLLGVLYSNSSSFDPKAAADSVNPKLSRWYSHKRVKNRINIFIVDFFESSRLHMDSFWMNKQRKIITKDW